MRLRLMSHVIFFLVALIPLPLLLFLGQSYVPGVSVGSKFMYDAYGYLAIISLLAVMGLQVFVPSKSIAHNGPMSGVKSMFTPQVMDSPFWGSVFGVITAVLEKYLILLSEPHVNGIYKDGNGVGLIIGSVCVWVAIAAVFCFAIAIGENKRTMLWIPALIQCAITSAVILYIIY